MSGVSSEGFVPATLNELLDDIAADLRETFGESVALHAQSRFGQLRGIIAERYADLWETAEDVYSSFDPDQATGTALDAICAFTGTLREASSPSTVTLTCTGTAGTILSLGRQVSVTSIGTKFETLAAATITALTAWVNTTAYVLGDRRSNGGNSYVVITAGTSAGSGGPTTTSSDITDGTVHWKYLGAGTAAVDVEAESQDDGPKTAVAGTLTVIETPVAGWSNVTNLLDADLGADEETDAALRIRREQDIRRSGKSTVEAITADLLDVDDVDAVTVFENTTDATNGDGLPPHSIECLVTGGTDADIAAALFDTKPAGIETYGTETETVTDSMGNDHTINFSRLTEKLAYVRVDLTKDPDTYPSDGDDQVKAAIVAWGDARGAGYDVVSSAAGAQAFSVAGVLDVTLTYVSISPTNPPVASTTIAISTRQVALYDTARITINSINGTP